MNIERDKYLTEAMGCAYSFSPSLNKENGFDFSTWEGFGKLWEWSQNQEWWVDFEITHWKPCGSMHFPNILIHPDRFADSIYAYLKERDNG